MTRAEIEDAIADILINDGPDGHCDGADIITDFVMALLSGGGGKWIEDYRAGEQIS